MRLIPVIIIAIAAIIGAIFLIQRSQEQERAAYLEQKKGEVQVDRSRAYVNSLPRISISDWKGKTTKELAAEFPGAKNLDTVCQDNRYDECDVSNWKGWRKVVLSFDKKRLTGVTFESTVPLAETEMAQIASDKFGVVLPKANYVVDGNDRGYERLSGNVSSVMFFGDLADEKKAASFVLFAEPQKASGLRSIGFKFSDLPPMSASDAP